MSVPIPDVNDAAKKVVVAALSEVPGVGVVLALLTDIFWPEDNTDPLQGMKDYVQGVMKQVLDMNEVEAVKMQVNMLKEHMTTLRKAKAGGSEPHIIEAEMDVFNKSQDVKSLLRDYQADQPWNTLPYLVIFGTIRLQCMRDIVDHYDKFFPPVTTGTPDQVEKAAEDAAKDLTGMKNDLKAEIKQLTGWVEQGRQRSVVRRNTIKSEVIPGGPQRSGYGWVEGPTTYVVTDAMDPNYSVQYMSQGQADMGVNNRNFDVFQSSDGYQACLDQILDAHRFWVFFGPETKYKPRPGPMYTFKCMGGNMDLGNAFNHASIYRAHGSISKLDFYWDGGALKGLQVWYGGFDSGLVGMKTNSSGTYGIGQEDGICVTGGYSGDWVDRFYYNTSGRRVQGQSVMGPAPVNGKDFAWQPEFHYPVQAGDSRVAYFAGYYAPSTRRIGQLKVAWVKTIEYASHLGNENEFEYGIPACHPQ